MSHLSLPYKNLKRSHSTASVAASDSSYHSFQDIQLYEPAPTSNPIQVNPPLRKEDIYQPTPMRRQDSGYESIPSGFSSGNSHDSNRRVSLTSSHSSHVRPRTRPSIHQATRSTPNPHISTRRSLQKTRPHYQPDVYFHFPSPESMGDDEAIAEVPSCHPPPPQTTHYWTSDHTRKLEYAAIDAASRGVKGWILKHVVPDCFVPKESRHVTFDDDTGSVRRYRLELDCEDCEEKKDTKGKKMGWLFGR